jgi:hypothetical protein
MLSFKEILFPSFLTILRESKIDIINKTDMTLEQKEEIIEFIKKYGDSALKEFNWNKPETIKYEKVKKDIDTWLQNRSIKSRNNFKIFENRKLFYPLHEDEEAWYYLPLSHEACLAANNYKKNVDQANNPDSPWCIGWDGTDEYWNSYVNNEYLEDGETPERDYETYFAFVFQIKKNPKNNKDIKYMYQIYPENFRKEITNKIGTYITFWDQDNSKEKPSENNYINSNADKIYNLFHEEVNTDIARFNRLLKNEENKNLFYELNTMQEIDRGFFLYLIEELHLEKKDLNLFKTLKDIDKNLSLNYFFNYFEGFKSLTKKDLNFYKYLNTIGKNFSLPNFVIHKEYLKNLTKEDLNLFNYFKSLPFYNDDIASFSGYLEELRLLTKKDLIFYKRITDIAHKSPMGESISLHISDLSKRINEFKLLEEEDLNFYEHLVDLGKKIHFCDFLDDKEKYKALSEEEIKNLKPDWLGRYLKN